MQRLAKINLGVVMGLGAAFGVVGWLKYDSLLIAIGLGIGMGFAFLGIPRKQSTDKENGVNET